jgi:hypothetical protein
MEIFKEFKDGYEVSNLGNVKNPNGGVLKLKPKNGGVKSFKVKLKDYQVHRVVLEVFNPIENMENKWVTRLDGNKENNKLENLTWIDKPLPRVKKETKNFKPTFYIPVEGEIFLSVIGYENKYIISNLGNIMEINSNIKLYQGYNNVENYVSCGLNKNNSRKNVKVAKEVLKAFKPKENEEYLTVHYLDNNPKNIKVENLEWKYIDTRPIKSIGEEPQELELLEGEIFVDCYGISNYQISNKGRLIHKYNKLIRKLKTSADGYKECSFHIDGKVPSYRIHRLVLMSFNPIEGMDDLYVNHINHVRDDNRLENLEWVTPKENTHHSTIKNSYYATGTVGIKTNGRGRFTINLNLGSANNYEEAQKILFESCKKLNIDTKYFIREEE